jgi:hypothetical protein
LSSFNHKKKEDRKDASGAKKLTTTKPSEVNHNEENLMNPALRVQKTSLGLGGFIFP